MSFDDAITAHGLASARLLGSDTTRTYRFAAGGTRPVNAIVRKLGTVEDDDGELARRVAIVFVPNDATNGITTEPADGDQIDVPLEQGAAAETCRVISVVSQGPEGFLLEVSP